MIISKASHRPPIRGWLLVGLALLAWGFAIGLAHQMAAFFAFITMIIGG